MWMSRAPKKFAAKTPVRSRIANAQQRAQARDVESEQRIGPRTCAARSSSVWSSIPTSAFSTQIVMPSGTQTSSPAIR